MHDARKILDGQLAGVCFTAGERQHILQAVRGEKKTTRQKWLPLLAATLLLALLSGAAVAATRLWGVEDFAQRSGMLLPTAPLQQHISQQGGLGRMLTAEVTDAVWDGQTVCIAVHVQPTVEHLLLMDACLAPDMPVGNLDRELPDGGTIADWAAAQGFTDLLGVDIEPMVDGRYLSHRVAWHLEENGGCTLFYEFDGVAEGPLDIVFQCVTWGWDEARGSFCDDARQECFNLTCTLEATTTP